MRGHGSALRRPGVSLAAGLAVAHRQHRRLDVPRSHPADVAEAVHRGLRASGTGGLRNPGVVPNGPSRPGPGRTVGRLGRRFGIRHSIIRRPGFGRNRRLWERRSSGGGRARRRHGGGAARVTGDRWRRARGRTRHGPRGHRYSLAGRRQAWGRVLLVDHQGACRKGDCTGSKSECEAVHGSTLAQSRLGHRRARGRSLGRVTGRDDASCGRPGLGPTYGQDPVAGELSRRIHTGGSGGVRPGHTARQGPARPGARQGARQPPRGAGTPAGAVFPAGNTAPATRHPTAETVASVRGGGLGRVRPARL